MKTLDFSMIKNLTDTSEVLSPDEIDDNLSPQSRKQILMDKGSFLSVFREIRFQISGDALGNMDLASCSDLRLDVLRNEKGVDKRLWLAMSLLKVLSLHASREYGIEGGVMYTKEFLAQFITTIELDLPDYSYLSEYDQHIINDYLDFLEEFYVGSKPKVKQVTTLEPLGAGEYSNKEGTMLLVKQNGIKLETKGNTIDYTGSIEGESRTHFMFSSLLCSYMWGLDSSYNKELNNLLNKYKSKANQGALSYKGNFEHLPVVGVSIDGATIRFCNDSKKIVKEGFCVEFPYTPLLNLDVSDLTELYEELAQNDSNISSVLVCKEGTVKITYRRGRDAYVFELQKFGEDNFEVQSNVVYSN